jgi:hypothetical protein
MDRGGVPHSLRVPLFSGTADALITGKQAGKYPGFPPALGWCTVFSGSDRSGLVHIVRPRITSTDVPIDTSGAHQDTLGIAGMNIATLPVFTQAARTPLFPYCLVSVIKH